jgi:hypothetical protein
LDNDGDEDVTMDESQVDVLNIAEDSDFALDAYDDVLNNEDCDFALETYDDELDTGDDYIIEDDNSIIETENYTPYEGNVAGKLLY